MSSPANPQTSGTYTYNPVAKKIITRAYRILAVINEDEEPTNGMLQTGMDTLSSMMKEWMASGIHVWTNEEAILFTQQYQARYLLYSGSPDHCCDANSWGLGSLGSNAATGATSITLSGNYGAWPPILPAKGMNIGISLDNGTAFWTTISAAPAGLVVPLTTALPSSASAQEFSYWYDPANAIQRPLRVPAARRIDFNVGESGAGTGPIETPLTNMMSRKEYMDLPNKQSPGQITQAYYNPARDQGEMYAWNVPMNVNSGLRFTYYRPLQDFDSVDDTADLPQEWDNCLNWNLAFELGPAYSVPAVRWDRIVATAQKKLELVQGWDRESESIYFGRGYDSTRR